MSSPPSSSNPNPKPATTKFKPRANVQRRTKAEREEYLAEEAERSKARAPLPAERGARGGRGRGRGGAPAVTEKDGRDARLRGNVEGGVFGGVGASGKPGRGKGRADGGVAELLSGPASVPEPVAGAEPDEEETNEKGKKKSTKSKEKVAVVADIGAEGTADAHVPVKTVLVDEDIEDDGPEEERRDIERIWISSDEEDTRQDEDDVVDTKRRRPHIKHRRSGAGGLRPVRAPRTILPKDEDEPATSKSKKLARPAAKSNATIDLDDMDIDETEVEFLREIQSSPEKKRSPQKKIHTKSKDGRALTGTVAERAERLRMHEDVSRLRSIFLGTADGDVISDSKGKGKKIDDDEGRLFLMQFPPITPFLIDPDAVSHPNGTIGAEDVMEIKDEPTSLTQAQTRPQPQTQPQPQPQPALQPQPSSTAQHIKKDPDPTSTTSQHTHRAAPTTLSPTSASSLPAGFIGKLNVHASGKISLDWGGVDMEVRLGSQVGFLEDVVVVDSSACRDETVGGGGQGSEAEAEGEGEGEGEGGGGGGGGGQKSGEDDRDRRGTVYSLGQIEGKMVVVPDWGRLYD